MAQATWEKTNAAAEELRQRAHSGSRLKFLIGGFLILAAVAYLIISGTATGAQYFITVDELVNNPEYLGQTVRISGAVLGPSIQYDAETLTIEFTMANIPTEFEDLAQALHEALESPNATRISVIVNNEVKPDLLQHEAQAILTGQLDDNGVFYASELLLKCPSRYEEVAPLQAEPEA
jgi:cytochrome c-type biogenesis protein CcmE